jgi:hypothetical protein
VATDVATYGILIFAVGSRVDVVVTSFLGAGSDTLTLDVQ